MATEVETRRGPAVSGAASDPGPGSSWPASTSRARWSRGPFYRKYKFAINRVWNVDDLDFTQDAADWQRIDDEQRRGLLGVTIRFLAGEQAVTDQLVPMIAASHALGRFDWVDVPRDVPHGGGEARRVLHALARRGGRRARARGGGAALPRPRQDRRPQRALRGPRRAPRGAARVRRRAARGRDRRRPRPRSSVPSSASRPPTTASWRAC